MEPTESDRIEPVESDPAAIVDDVEAIAQAESTADFGAEEVVGPYAMEDLLALFEDLDRTVLQPEDGTAETVADGPGVDVELVPGLLEELERAAAAAGEPVDPDREVDDEAVARLIETVEPVETGGPDVE